MIAQMLPRQKHSRTDGWLCELISMNHLDHPFSDIHSYIVSIAPFNNRANHYHKKKEEWIGIAAGMLEIHLEDIRTKKQEKILVDSKSHDYSLIHIRPFIAHTIENISSSEASVIVFSNTPEDKADTIPYKVII